MPGFRSGCFQSKLIMVEQSLMTRKFRQRRRFGERGSPIFRYAESEIYWETSKEKYPSEAQEEVKAGDLI